MSTETAATITRLREYAAAAAEHGYFEGQEICNEAAGALEALQKRADTNKSNAMGLHDKWVNESDRVAQLEEALHDASLATAKAVLAERNLWKTESKRLKAEFRARGHQHLARAIAELVREVNRARGNGSQVAGGR